MPQTNPQHLVAWEDIKWRTMAKEPITKTIKRRKWRWVGHTWRRAEGNIARTTQEWNPQRQRRRDWPNNTFCSNKSWTQNWKWEGWHNDQEVSADPGQVAEWYASPMCHLGTNRIKSVSHIKNYLTKNH